MNDAVIRVDDLELHAGGAAIRYFKRKTDLSQVNGSSQFRARTRALKFIEATRYTLRVAGH